MRVHGHYGGTGQLFPAALLYKRVLVTGGREYGEGRTVDAVLAGLDPYLVIQGGARGADAFAAGWAHRMGVPYLTVPVAEAAWRISKRAGHDRNKRMLGFCPDFVVAFPGGNGTANMCEQAADVGLRIIRVSNDGPTDFTIDL